MKAKLMDVYEVGGCGLVLLCLILVLALVFGILCFEGWLIMLLWNWVAVSLFNAPAIGYWLGVGIVVCLNLLSKVFTIRIKTEE